MDIIHKCFAATFLISVPMITNAASVIGQGTWETTLQARDLDGNLSTVEAFYDTDLNITWLADGALTLTQSFGVEGINAYNGRLPSWEVSNEWIDAMNINNYLGQSSWRLPVILDTSDINAIKGLDSDPSRSEMASLFYNTFGNEPYYLDGTPNPNPGLTNTAQFSNFQAYYYWTSTESSPGGSYAWSFAMHNGDQYRRAKLGAGYVLRVIDGDIGSAIVPLPSSIWLLGSGLIGLIGIAKRKKA